MAELWGVNGVVCVQTKIDFRLEYQTRLGFINLDIISKY